MNLMSKFKGMSMKAKIIFCVICVALIAGVVGGVLYDQHIKAVEVARIESAKDNAKHVDSMIKGFKEVTLDKEKDLEKVNKAYKNLTKEEKGFVTEKKTLDKLNKTLSSLKEQAKKDKEVAMSCMDKINAIGEVTLDSEAKITDARNTYNALTDTQKTLVTNLDTLTNAESALSAKKEEQTKATAKANEEARNKAQANTRKTQTNNQANNTPTQNANNAGTSNSSNDIDWTTVYGPDYHAGSGPDYQFSWDFPGYNSPEELPDGYRMGPMVWSKERQRWYMPYE
jgi:hypothetical protein